MSNISHDQEVLDTPLELHSFQVDALPHNDMSKGGSWATVDSFDGSEDKLALSNRALWSPFYLRRWCYIWFATIFVSIIVALEVVRIHSDRTNGLASVHANMHYLWTFGPTGVLTVVAAFWGQVEYRTKQMAPWEEMWRHQATPARSLLLDYLSPWNIQTMFLAIKASHYSVFTSILGSLLLRLLIVLSTGLLVLKYPSIETTVALESFDDFDFSRFDDQSRSGGAASLTGSFAPALFNMSYPDGTNKDYATQSFKVKHYSNATIKASLNVFHADLDCESAEWSHSDPDMPYMNVWNGTHSTFDIWTPTCRISTYSMNAMGIKPYADAAIGYDDDSGVGWVFNNLMLEANCSNVTGSVSESARRYVAAIGYTGLYTSKQATVSPTSEAARPVAGSGPSATGLVLPRQLSFGPDGEDDTPTEVLSHYLNLTVAICVPQYSLGQALVSVQGSSATAGAVQVSNFSANNSATQPEVSSWALSRAVLNLSGPCLLTATSDGTGFIIFMNTTSPQPGAWNFMDPSVFHAALAATYRSLAVQWTKQYLTTATPGSLSGTEVLVEPRLFTEILTLRLMDGVLALLGAIALSLCFYGSRPSSPCDPASLDRLSTILVRSQALKRSLSGLGPARLGVLRRWLHGYRFQTKIKSHAGEPSFGIQPILDMSCDSDIDGVKKISIEANWWQLVSLTIPFRLLTILGPLAMIVALEIVLRISNLEQGLGDAPDSGYLRYLWLYVPALIMVGTTSIFGMLDFSVRTVQPFHRLLKTGGTAEKTLSSSWFGKVALHALLNSLARREYALSATLITICISPVLTIAVSGLFQAQSIPRPEVSMLRVQNTFNKKSIYNLFSHVDESAMASVIMSYENVSWPQWTYENLVIPELELIRPDANENLGANYSSVLPMEVQVPVARVAPRCSLLSNDQIVNLTVTHLDIHAGNLSSVRTRSQVLLASVSIPKPHERAIHSKTLDYYITSLPSDGYFGAIPTIDSKEQLVGSYINGPSEYPDILFFFGKIDRKTVVDLSMVWCLPQIEEVRANISFTMPDLLLDESRSPIVEEQSARFFTNDSSIFEAPTFPQLNGSISPFFQGPISGFFNAIINGKNGTPAADLSGPAGSERLVAAIQRQYGIFIAQRFSTYCRNYTTPTDPATYFPNVALPINATITDPNHLRIVQSVISTRILDGLLGAMSLCAIISWISMDTRKVLPKNPCSIAAVASLLADSDMLNGNVTPKGSEWCTDKELKKRCMFDGYLYSMGRWHDGPNKRARFGIDIGRAQRTP